MGGSIECFGLALLLDVGLLLHLLPIVDCFSDLHVALVVKPLLAVYLQQLSFFLVNFVHY